MELSWLSLGRLCEDLRDDRLRAVGPPKQMKQEPQTVGVP